MLLKRLKPRLATFGDLSLARFGNYLKLTGLRTAQACHTLAEEPCRVERALLQQRSVVATEAAVRTREEFVGLHQLLLVPT